MPAVSVWILEFVDTMCFSCIILFTFQIFWSFVVAGSYLNDNVVYYCG